MKFLGLFVIFLYTNFSHAFLISADSGVSPPLKSSECRENFLGVLESKSEESLSAIQENIDGPYSSVDGNILKESLCRESLDFARMQREMETLTEEREDFQLRGFELKNQPPSLVKALSELIVKTDAEGDALENQSKISAHDYLKTLCDSAVCVAKRLFGKRIGVKVLYLKWKYGLNASHMTNDKASHIEEEEVDSFLRVASDFPPGLWDKKGNQRMVKYERGVRMISRYGGISLANSKMEFFDGWTRESKYDKDAITAHEMAHFIGKSSGADTTREWLRLSGWQKQGEAWSAKDKDELISQNSKKSPQEDFAEAVMAYRYAPDNLLKIGRDKYEYLKEHVFRGQEYRALEQCQ